MKIFIYATFGLVSGLNPLFAGNPEWSCPDGNRISIQSQGNTETRSCLDSTGKPHGPFEVWAMPDSLATKPASILLRGHFDHGNRIGDWVAYGPDGSILESGEFLERRNVKPARSTDDSDSARKNGVGP